MDKVSACIMVRANTFDNPDFYFKQCLQNLKPIVDEFIIVNTRLDSDPPDNMNKIAEEFDAKIYMHPWENDFSKHRTQSIEYASGEWLFCIDADEAIYFNVDAKNIKQYLTTLPKDIGGIRALVKDVQQNKVVMEFPTVKIFRKGCIEYTRAVHNKPNVKGKVVDYGGIYIKHYGYDLSPEKSQAKKDRTIALLYDALEKDPTDYHSLFYLNQQYSLLGDHENCIKYADLYLEHRDDCGETFNPTVYFTAIRSLMFLKDIKKAGIYMEQAMHDAPNDLDICLMTVEYGNTVGNPELITMGANKFMQIYQQMNDPKSGYARPGKFIFTNNLDSLAFVMFSLGMTRYKESMHHFNNLSSVFPQLSSDAFREQLMGYMRNGITSGVSSINVVFKPEEFGKNYGPKNEPASKSKTVPLQPVQ